MLFNVVDVLNIMLFANVWDTRADQDLNPRKRPQPLRLFVYSCSTVLCTVYAVTYCILKLVKLLKLLKTEGCTKNSCLNVVFRILCLVWYYKKRCITFQYPFFVLMNARRKPKRRYMHGLFLSMEPWFVGLCPVYLVNNTYIKHIHFEHTPRGKIVYNSGLSIRNYFHIRTEW